jgi:hypothetical protein
MAGMITQNEPQRCQTYTIDKTGFSDLFWDPQRCQTYIIDKTGFSRDFPEISSEEKASTERHFMHLPRRGLQPHRGRVYAFD